MRTILVLGAAAVLLAASIPPALVQAQEALPPEPDSGAVVCVPDIYLSNPDSCLALGPSAYLTSLARKGITYPQRPLPAAPPDPALAQVPFKYFHLDEKSTVPVYSAPGETGAGGLSFPPGFVYVSYTDRVDTGSGIYYYILKGGWIPGKGNRISEISAFMGLAFSSTPRNSFGWAFEQIPVLTAPGYNAAQTGSWVNTYQVVQIFDTQNIEGTEWNMIGPDQWVEARKVAQVIIDTAVPPGVNASRWINVDLAEQTLSVYDNGRLVYATVIASGMEPFWTRPGSFQIFKKVEAETMSNSDPSDFYYLENVPWTMYFDGARALHGAYWRTRLGYPQSHGCVNLSVGDAHWLFNWAVDGDWVYVHDRTGLTPTDPALYPAWAY